MINQKYINENNLELLVDIFETGEWSSEDADTTQWQLYEGANDPSGIVDGVNILGRAVGPFFVVDGKSQNNRFYEHRLWERVLKEVQTNIDRGSMLGTIGHGQPLDDSALLEGRVSHRVSKLWIDREKKLGMGEMLILNTPAGRTLNAYLRGGVQFPVSSRGYGKYAGKMEDGTQIVDPDSYKLETFDFVRIPGIAQAIPRLVEEKEETIPRIVVTEDYPKPDAKASPVKESSVPTTAQVSESAPQHKRSKLMEDTQILTRMTEEKIRLEEQLRTALESNTKLQETINALQGQSKELTATVEEYRRLGSTEEISRVLDVTEEMLHNRPMEESNFVALQEALEVYEELGTPEELSDLFQKFEGFIDQYEGLGNPEEINVALDNSMQMMEAYEQLGSPVEINEAFDTVETFMGEMRELGTIEELTALCDLLEAYQEFGTPTELKNAFSMMDAVVENTRTAHIEGETNKLAEEFGLSPANARAMVESMGGERARTVLTSMNESRPAATTSPAARYKVGTKVSEATVRDDDAVALHEERTIMNSDPSNRASRLFEKLGR